MMLRQHKQSNIIDIVNGMFGEVARPGDYLFRMIGSNVKNQLIFRVAERMNETFVEEFIAYLSLIGDKNLDGYSSVTFNVREYNTRIQIKTQIIGGHLIIEVPSLIQGPPKDMIKNKKWYSRFFSL